MTMTSRMRWSWRHRLVALLLVPAALGAQARRLPPGREGSSNIRLVAHLPLGGYLHVTDAPGLGTDIDEALAAKYPYSRAYLPMSRRADGSVQDW